MLFATLAGFFSNLALSFGKEKALHAGGLDALLDEMASDYESANFEGLDADEKRVLKKLAIKNPAVVQTAATRQRSGAIQHYGQIVNPETITSLIVNSVGDLNITVTRTGVAINSPLPYVLFGLQGLTTSFVSALRPYLPSGTTCVATTSAGNIVLTYTSGLNVDVVTISMSGLISYAEFLQTMNQNYFATKYIRYEIADDANRIAQQSEQISFGTLSALGAQNANQLMPRSRVMSWDYNKGITNLLMPEQEIVSDFSFVQRIIKIEGYAIAWDVFMSKRINLNKAVK